ncbi:MAG: hypothetical protein H0X44_06300 [Acidobacteria bacterium]|nr:hypothetical protein [Acidobacteriota bacterium]
MSSLRSLLIAAALVLAAALPAQAVTLRDLVDLSKSGLSDEILIALVEAERSVFHLNAADVQELKRQGLSDRVLLHLLRTPAIREDAARAEAPAYAPEPEPRVPARTPSPQVVVIDRVETIAVPVYLPIYVPSPRPEKPEKPVYWGWGGKRRPDSWKDPDRRSPR